MRNGSDLVRTKFAKITYAFVTIYSQKYGGIVMSTIEMLEREKAQRDMERAKTMFESGYAISEISRVLDRPESTVRSWIYRSEK